MERVSALHELLPQFARVIDFPVVRDPDSAFGVGHRHAAALAQIENREACARQNAIPEKLDSLAIRAAVRHGIGHAGSRRHEGLGGLLSRYSGYAAHLLITVPPPSPQLDVRFAPERPSTEPRPLAAVEQDAAIGTESRLTTRNMRS